MELSWYFGSSGTWVVGTAGPVLVALDHRFTTFFGPNFGEVTKEASRGPKRQYGWKTARHSDSLFSRLHSRFRAGLPACLARHWLGLFYAELTAPRDRLRCVSRGVPSPNSGASGAQAPVVFRPPPGPLLYRWFRESAIPLNGGAAL